MSSQNFEAKHALDCPVNDGRFHECTCGLRHVLPRAGKRQEEQDDSTRIAAQQEAEALAREERIPAALERIAAALEGLFILQRGHATECSWFSHGGYECDCDLATLRRLRQGRET